MILINLVGIFRSSSVLHLPGAEQGLKGDDGRVYAVQQDGL